MKRKICFIGGDERNDILADLLKEEFFILKYTGEEMKKFLEGASLVVSGIPFSRDDIIINANETLGKISIESIFSNMEGNKKLIAGSFSNKVKELASRYNIKLYDFLDSEDFAIYNAIPTAEGAIEVAMNLTKKTIHSSNCLILGFGRIGKVLADLLKGLHANVTVVARKDKDFAWIKTMGYIPISYAKLNSVLPSIDIVFNTVPALVMKDEINYLKSDASIIDLASKPGGIDFNIAKEKGIKADLYLGLPGKVAPRSISEYMLTEVKKLI